MIGTQLATKADIADVRRDIVMVKQGLTIRVGAMVIALDGFSTALKFFGH